MNSERVRPFERLRRNSAKDVPCLVGFWSYPSLFAEGNRTRWLCLVMGTVPMPAKGRTALFRPRALVTADAVSGEMLSHADFHKGHDPFPSAGWDEPVAMFPHRGVADLTYAEFSRREKALLDLYPAAVERFATGGELMPRFVDAYRELSHPVVYPYLRHLVPGFFAGLGIERDE